MNPNVRDGVRDNVRDGVRVKRLLKHRKPFIQGTFRDPDVRVRVEMAFYSDISATNCQVCQPYLPSRRFIKARK